MNRRHLQKAPSRDSDSVAFHTTRDGRAVVGNLNHFPLRFRDREVERRFRAHFASHNITNLRIGHVLGIIMWALWGAVVTGYMDEADRSIDLFIRYRLLIPLTFFSLAFTSWAAIRASGKGRR
jgi:hypothetical protein